MDETSICFSNFGISGLFIYRKENSLTSISGSFQDRDEVHISGQGLVGFSYVIREASNENLITTGQLAFAHFDTSASCLAVV